jgi:hypothetical protein
MDAHPSCETCRFYTPGRYVRTGTCARFIAYRGRGKLVYEWADSVRLNESKCGPEARLYVARKPEKNVLRESQKIWLELLDQDE